jgi:tetratricopeptide (TPR) repeat protein/uncharacterized membrane protein YeaQ/YmgE (transglycosylase-associated protein family)
MRVRGWLLLLLVTAAVYAPAWHGTPVWDDGGHLTRTDLQSIDGLRRIWTEIGATQQYYPVVHTAFWVQHQLWGDSTLGYHLVNILLHATSAWLVVLILLRLGIPGAWLAGLIFALHPVHVESVAWISELKNTLSGAFALTAVYTFLRYRDTGRAGLYALTLLVFALALMSKSVTATVPVVLLVIAWWQRGTLEWRTDVRPVVPLIVMGVVAGMVTVLVERWYIGAQGDAFAFSWIERTLIAGRASWFYLGSLAWPVALSFNYSRWVIDAGIWWQYLFPVAMAATVGTLWWQRERLGRGPLAGLVIFLITVAPALGFVNVYPFRFSFVADHFQYLASLGIIVVAAAGMATLAQRWSASQSVRFALAVVLCAPLALQTWRQSHHYADEESLYRATLATNPQSWLAHTNLSAILVHRTEADVRQATTHARAALALKPDSPAVQYNLALALERQGAFLDAASHYRAAIELFDPTERDAGHVRMVRAHHRLGVALAGAGRVDDAIAAHREALRHAPTDPDIHTDLAMVLAASQHLDDAITHFETAAQYRPDPSAFNNLGGAHLQAGRFEDAVRWLERAVALDSRMVDAFYNLGTALIQLEQWGDAIRAYQQVLALVGPSPDLLARVGILSAEAGDTPQARRYLQDALRLDPTHALATTALRDIGGPG